jgi:hypothetical protein
VFGAVGPIREEGLTGSKRTCNVRRSMMVLMPYSSHKRDLSEIVASSGKISTALLTVPLEGLTRPCRAKNSSFNNTPRREDQPMSSRVPSAHHQ